LPDVELLAHALKGLEFDTAGMALVEMALKRSTFGRRGFVIKISHQVRLPVAT